MSHPLANVVVVSETVLFEAVGDEPFGPSAFAEVWAQIDAQPTNATNAPDTATNDAPTTPPCGHPDHPDHPCDRETEPTRH